MSAANPKVWKEYGKQAFFALANTVQTPNKKPALGGLLVSDFSLETLQVTARLRQGYYKGRYLSSDDR
jgi:hypothetical protein